MRIQIIKLGKPAHAAYAELVAQFEKRLKGLWKVENHIVRISSSLPSGKELYPRLGLSPQGDRVDPSHCLVLLDERGQEWSSPEFAHWCQDKVQWAQCKTLSFVIGGPFGLDPELRSKADRLWKLSSAVYPSDLAWLVVWEQLYRAASIIKGSPYHHDG